MVAIERVKWPTRVKKVALQRSVSVIGSFVHQYSTTNSIQFLKKKSEFSRTFEDCRMGGEKQRESVGWTHRIAGWMGRNMTNPLALTTNLRQNQSISW